MCHLRIIRNVQKWVGGVFGLVCREITTEWGAQREDLGLASCRLRRGLPGCLPRVLDKREFGIRVYCGEQWIRAGISTLAPHKMAPEEDEEDGVF